MIRTRLRRPPASLLAPALVLVLLLGRPVSAQPGLSGAQNPPHIRWLELSSAHFRLIFPPELQADAMVCVNLLEHLREGLSAGFEAPVRRTTIVLSNQQGLANGYVGFFPYRSEWFHVAPAESLLGTLEWYSLLAVHEGRHMAQLGEVRRGSIVAARVLAGELGEAALIFGLGAPAWFMEGDATLAETLATESGRGRNPGFQRPLRTAALQADLPSWRQALYGSYRRGPVNPYELGYYLTARLRRDFGPAAAGEILRGAGRWALVPGAFERNVRRVTGMSAAELYRSTLEELEASWREQTAGLRFTAARGLVADEAAAKRDAAVYHDPSGADGGIVAWKTGLSREPVIVRLDEAGREEVLLAALPLGGLTARGDRVVWAQHYPHPRWGNRSTLDLVELRLSSGAVRRLTRGRVLQSPALSPDGGRVAAVEVLPDRSSRLLVFEVDGGETEEHRAGAGAHLQEPAWSADGRRLYVYRTTAQGKALLEVDPGTGRARELLPPGRELLEGLEGWGDYVLFGSDWSGLMNVYALDLSSGRVWQVTSRPYGVAGFSARGDELLFADGAPRGLLPAAAALRPGGWVPKEEVPVRRVDLFRPIIEAEGLAPLVDPAAVPRQEYAVRPYRPGLQEILPHSWLLTSAADGEQTESAGLTLFSAGMLQDRALAVSAGWDFRHGGPEGAVSLELGRWFPQLLSTAAYELRDFPGTGENARSVTGGLGVRLPLILDGVQRQAGLVLEGRYETGPVWARGQDLLFVQELGAEARAFIATRLAARDLAPRWGLALEAAGRVELPNAAVDEPRPGLSAGLSVWLPGLLRHHSLQLSSTLAADDSGDLHPVPRGYAGDLFAGDTVAGATAAYRFPLAYPDVGLGSWLHLPRLIGGVFGDLAFEPQEAAETLRASVGLEMIAELNILTPLPLQAGVQLIYRFEDGRFAFRETVLGLTAVLGDAR